MISKAADALNILKARVANKCKELKTAPATTASASLDLYGELDDINSCVLAIAKTYEKSKEGQEAIRKIMQSQRSQYDFTV